MDNDLKTLLDTFISYRDLLTPIQANLSEFAQSYEGVKGDIEKLNSSIGDNVSEELSNIHNTLAKQAQVAQNLTEKIGVFVEQSNRYTDEVQKIYGIFAEIEDRITAVNSLGERAENQLEKLDKLLREKSQSYDIDGLKNILSNYNDNVNTVSEFINSDMTDLMGKNSEKLTQIEENNKKIADNLATENKTIGSLLGEYQTTNTLLKQISEKSDVNEVYIFEILDRWAEARKVKVRK